MLSAWDKNTDETIGGCPLSFVKVYVQAFDEDKNYTGSFTEITSDVDLSSIGKIKQSIDNQNFNVGVFKYTNLNLKVNNTSGKYSEPGNLRSIFINKRIDSIVKVTWCEEEEGGPICGIAICGNAVLGGEINVFYGLLNDIASSQDIADSILNFSVQGLESLFSRVATNYSSLSGSDTISDIIYDLLNQTSITDLMTVSALNISCSIDQVPDDITGLEETTVKEALDQLLEASNSILYVSLDDQTIYVTPRTPGGSVSFSFYGQSSDSGSENIVDIKGISTGLNRTFNFWKWRDTTLTSKDATSISTYGVRKKELDIDLITNTTKRNNILSDYKDEFYTPKQELKLTTILDYNTVELFFLDRVDVDYPAVFSPSEDGLIARYGTAVYGTNYYPYGSSSFSISTSTNYKVIGRSVDMKKNLVELELRGV